MSTCTACAEVERNPQTGRYNSDCDACTVRAVALSPQHFDAKRAGRITPEYRAMLDKVFGPEWEAGHARVKAWVSANGVQA